MPPNLSGDTGMKLSRVVEFRASLKDEYAAKYSDDIEQCSKGKFINLLDKTKEDINTEMYDTESSVVLYRNFLNWLFATFEEDEQSFRKECFDGFGCLQGKKILITSCGLGEDVTTALDLVGEEGVVHAQDLSKQFVSLSSEKNSFENAIFNVSDALSLPYRDNYFDAVYHFGGINLFGDIKKAIAEMERVCKVGSKIIFGDESVALHLRDTDYGRMLINNNSLWNEKVPLEHLPVNASDINLTYILGNCFYLISFKKRSKLPAVNIDIPHIGHRGGSIRKRYFGSIEGIDVSLKDALYKDAKEKNTSVSGIIEKLVKRYLY
jgi:SAM-dependent methyltransferase